MVPSTNQPGFFFLKNSIVFKIKLSTQKNYGEKKWSRKEKKKQNHRRSHTGNRTRATAVRAPDPNH